MRHGFIFRQLFAVASILLVTGLVAGSSSSASSASSSRDEEDAVNDANILRHLALEHHTPYPTRRPTSHPTPHPTPGPPTVKPTGGPAPNVDVDVLGCFSSKATVTVRGKESPVAMTDLQVGDYVLTGATTTSGPHYSPVYAFGHYAPDKRSEFVQIYTTTASATATTTAGAPLEMTKEHLVFLRDKLHPVRADSVQVGDVLRTTCTGSRSGSNHGEEEGWTVTKIDKIWRSGLYAPFTQAGTLVVDGIVASSYISLQGTNSKEYLTVKASTSTSAGRAFLGLSQHDYVHMGLSPLRLVCTLAMSMPTANTTPIRFCSPSTSCPTANSDTHGMPPYAAFAVTLNRWAHQQQWLVEIIVLLVIMGLTGSCWMLETLVVAVLDASWLARTVMLVMAALCIALPHMYDIKIQRACGSPKKKKVKSA